MGSRRPPYAEHPFFWSGYLLVDTGVSPADDEEALGAEQDFPGEEPKKVALGPAN